MAVYTKISDDQIKEYLRSFDIGSVVSFDDIEGGINNSNYRLITSGGKYILTIIEHEEYKKNMNLYLSFIESLNKKDIPCPKVIYNIKGEWHSVIKGKLSIISGLIEGEHIKDIKTIHVKSIAKLLAKMHLAVEGLTVKGYNMFSLAECKKVIEKCGNNLDTIEGELSFLLKEELIFLKENKPAGLPSGIVHADLFPDNVFFNKENAVSGIIDFYLSCSEVFIYDLMITINAWCFNKSGEIDKNRLNNFIESYESIRPLTADEKKALPIFGRVTALRIITSRAYDWLNPKKDALVVPNDPKEYLNILKFYQKGGFDI